jgi:Domain of unknown function (DUF6438)
MHHSETKHPRAMRAPIYTISAICFLLVTLPAALKVLSSPLGILGSVTEISLERNECYGTCPIDTLVLRLDGTAVYTGKQYTQRTGQFTGTLRKSDFDKLAQRLISAGFFDLKSSYGRSSSDSSYQVIRATRDGKQKSVVNHENGESATLSGIQRVIEGAGSDVHWQPVRSGIRGVATGKLPGEAWSPLSRVTILIFPSDGKQAFSVRTDDKGRFQIALMPGTYRFSTQLRVNSQQTVVVHPDEFSDASFQFDRATGRTTMPDGTTAGGDSPRQK